MWLSGAICDIIAWCLVKYITSKAGAAPNIGSAFLTLEQQEICCVKKHLVFKNLTS